MSVERKLEWLFAVQILALVDRLFQEKASWPELIKQTRGASGVDYRINHDPECKKQASRHIKIHGPSSLISSVGGSFAVAEREVNERRSAKSGSQIFAGQ
jgi:hypothetical protein